MACSIRRLVAGVNGLVLLTTKDTVAIDTPAACATSRMVAIPVPPIAQPKIGTDLLTRSGGEQHTLPQLG